MRKIILSILGVLLVVGAVFTAKTLIANKKKPKPIVKKVIKSVYIDTVQNHIVPIIIPANGRLVSKQRIELYSEVQGIFKKGSHLFKAGQTYQKGDRLIVIDNTEHYASVQAAKSNLYNTIAAIMPDLRLDFKEAYPKWQAYLRDFDMEKETPALPKMTSDKENYFITGRSIVSSYYNVKNLEQRLNKYTIKAPFTGILTESLATERSLIRNGQKLGEFINPSVYEMEISVSKSYANVLKIGEQVHLSNLDKTQEYQGTITRVNGSIDATTQTISLFIEVKDPNLKEGLYLDANINAESVDNAIEIDRSLLLESHEIFVVKNGALSLMSAKPIHFSDTKVILQNIPNGTIILKSPIPGAYAGMLVAPFTK